MPLLPARWIWGLGIPLGLAIFFMANPPSRWRKAAAGKEEWCMSSPSAAGSDFIRCGIMPVSPRVPFSEIRLATSSENLGPSIFL